LSTTHSEVRWRFISVVLFKVAMQRWAPSSGTVRGRTGVTLLARMPLGRERFGRSSLPRRGVGSEEAGSEDKRVSAELCRVLLLETAGDILVS